MGRTPIRRYLIRWPTPLAVTALALAGVAASSGVAGAAPTSTAAGAGGAGAGAPSRAGPGHQAASRHRGPGPLPTPGLGVDLGPNVYVFDPAMPESRIQATVDAIADQQVPNQFGSQRYALLFEPGTYGSAAHPLVFQVGYYTEVAGLGTSPGDVTIHGSIDVHNQCTTTAGKTSCTALDNFWRSLSNLTIDLPKTTSCYTNAEFWAVSQAAPMRRVAVNGGNVTLQDYCTAGPQYASGGFIAGSTFSGGTIINGSQQQFIVRNSNLDGWTNGVWNQVFVGDHGAPPQSFTSGDPQGTPPYTTVARTPVSQAPPFLTTDAGGRLQVRVPALRHDSVGPSWTSGATPGATVPIGDFFVARPGDRAGRINAALARGQDLLLTPGVYHLDHAISVTRPDTVVLGLGFATLVPEHGNPAMRVASVPGVELSGMIFDAGPVSSPVLLQVGGCAPASGGHGAHGRPTGHGRCRPVPEGPGAQGPGSQGHGQGKGPGHGPAPASNRAHPTLVSDVFFRIGGATPGRAVDSLVVDSSHVILDDVWAWRADHGAGVGWTKNTAATGVVVNGNDVTAYGLFVEHYQKDEVVWNGQGGKDFFFQNEMPYDPPSQAAWMATPATNGYPAFVVSPGVTSFQGYGMGSYCYFDQGVAIHSAEAFSVPHGPGVQLHDIFTRFLNGSGGIDHVIDGTGPPVNAASPGPSDLVSYP